MKIGIDCRFLSPSLKNIGGNTGNFTYTYNFIKFLEMVDEENQYILYLLKDSEYFQNNNFYIKWMPSFHRNSYLRALLTFPWELHREPVDIFHGMYSMPLLRPKKAVVSLFEFSWLIYPHYYPKKISLPASVMTKMTIRRADKIITGTNFMKSEILNHFPISEEKIEVIPLGLDESFFKRAPKARIERVKQRYGIEGPYIMSAGTLWPKKNIERLVEAFSLLKQLPKFRHKLVLAGPKLWKFDQLLRKITLSRAREDIILTGYVSLHDLQILYQGAEIFVFPSLYEGFGIPVLEAMASGTPVVLSNSSSFPEIAGEAGVYFNPLDTKNMAETISEVVKDASYREKLTALGLERAKDFSWVHTAKKTLAVYKSLSR